MAATSLIIDTLKTGAYQVNTYLVACPETREGCIIDPGGETERIIRAVNEMQIQPRFILNTHGHRDHVPVNAALARLFEIPICMHKADIGFFTQRAGVSDPDFQDNYKADRKLSDKDIIRMGNRDIQVLHTPGHTPGSVCFYVNGCIFTGDTLFVGNAGRTDLPGGDLATLIYSIKTRLVGLPPQTIVYPGHDYGTTPVSTIGRETKENIYITDFILSDENT